MKSIERPIDRLPEFDFLRGLAILGVVLIHVAAVFFPLINSGSSTYYILLFINQSQKFCVPAFLLASGFFLSWKNENEKEPTEVLKKRLSRILPPYLIWSLFFYLLTLGTAKESFNLGTFMAGIMTGSVVYVYYFILLIIQCYLVSWFLAKFVKMNDNNLTKLLLISLAVQAIYTIYNYLSIAQYVPEIVARERWILGWIFYFSLGWFLGKKYNSAKKNIKEYSVWIISAIIVFLIISIVEAELIVYFFQDFEFSRSSFKLSTTLYAIFFCLASLQVSREIKFLNNLAKFSFPIFLIHAPIVAIAGFQIYKIVNNIWIAFPLTFIIGLSIPYYFSDFVASKLPKKFKKYLLGL